MSFPTTHWSLLATSVLNNEGGAQAALEHLCRQYWTPLNYFIRARGYGEADAADLTQEFLCHITEHSTLRAADRERGHFRTFLLGVLSRFLHDEHARRQALKRGGGAPHVSLDDEQIAVPGVDAADAIRFDREWGLAILESAVREAETEYSKDGGSGRFAILRRFLPGAVAPPTYENAAAEMGVSVAVLTSDVHRLRQRFKTLVRQEIGRTVSAPHELDDEMVHLQRVLMDRGHDFDARARVS